MIVIIIINSFAISYAGTTKTYISPDNQLIAKVTRASKSEESIVDIIEMNNGLIISHNNYASEDGEHGQIVEKAAWTPDGQFFIFTTSSSGGHSPWQSVSCFFSVRYKKIYDFRDFFPAIAKAGFTVASPDLITITIWTPLTQEKSLDDSVMLSITFHMAELLQSKGMH